MHAAAVTPESPSAVADPARPLTVALVGNPNTGKSTLFNALSGLKARVGNYPGVTVEKKVGRTKYDGQAIRLVDLPGTYSLAPRSLDEMVSVDVLLGRQADVGTIDAVVCIVDAANLERNLYLVSQVLDIGLPLVLVLNMSDVAQARGVTIDAEALSQRLGVRVVRTEAHRRRGLDEVRRAIVEAAGRPAARGRKLFPPAFYDECEQLAAKLQGGPGLQISNLAAGRYPTSGDPNRQDLKSVNPTPALPLYILERLLLDVGGYVESRLDRQTTFDLPAYLSGVRQRLAAEGCRVPAAEAKVRYAWARQVLEGVMTRPASRPETTSDRLDRVLTHRFAGLVVFGVLMFVVFQAIYTWAGPFMEGIEAAQGWLGGAIAGAMPPGAFRSLLIDGAVAGVGGVIVFLPQIMLLFLFIAILEDCGYMARAAFLMDKLMSKVGLSGKSFVPLMSSFACAIPGVMATRVIENRRERMVTILVAPLMSCSARLPVYLLLIAAFIPAVAVGGVVSLQGLVLFAMTSLGALVAIPVAWILKKTFFKGETPPFVMELPEYKWPSPRVVLSRVYDRAMAFITRAGTLIFAATILIWAAAYFPADRGELHALEANIESLEETNEPSATEAARLEQLRIEANQLSSRLMKASILGHIGHTIEPVVRPLGWDWRIGVGAIASFPAREVIIATLGTIYSLGGEVDEEDEGLRSALREASWPDGRRVYTVPVALSIMVFFALCAQCAATLMVIKRETNSWRWPAFTFAYMTILAYLGALVTYQVGALLT